MTTQIRLRCKDGRFIRGDDDVPEWTLAPQSARLFPTARAAHEFACRHALAEMEIIIERDESPALRVPLP